MVNVTRYLLVLITGCLLMVSAQSCGDSRHTAYSHFEPISSKGWDPSDMISFEPAPLDSTAPPDRRYDLQLVLRESIRREVRDFPIVVAVEDENGPISSDTVMTSKSDPRHISTRDKYGTREITLTVARGIRLTDGYALTVSPLAERESTAGVIDIGLVMTPTYQPDNH